MLAEGNGDVNLLELPRFQSKFRICARTGCWIWVGGQNRNGYGRFYLRGGRKYKMAHRYAYETFVGPIPEGLLLDHLCRVRHCCNPFHAEPVTVRRNTLRGEGPTAKAWNGDPKTLWEKTDAR